MVNLQIMKEVMFRDLGEMDYRQAWDYQEELLQENVYIKAEFSTRYPEYVSHDLQAGSHDLQPGSNGLHPGSQTAGPATRHHLLFVEHPSVYTLGKSGHMENILIKEDAMRKRGIQFFKTNRGGDITYHGPGQIVGYPILDLEKFYRDIGRYLRNLEEVVIGVLAEYGIKGDRSSGETGVWLDPDLPGRERKICAIGVRCSRWITMHGFAFNVNTDLSPFGYIVPCGIRNKQVTSLEKELGHPIPLEEVKAKLKQQFEKVFEAKLKTPSE
jgi:lipoyl(octanoyl) transferase